MHSAAVHRQTVLIEMGRLNDWSKFDGRLLLGTVVVISLATIANAGPNTIATPDRFIVPVAEGCGPGWWRGPEGRCHPMARGRACPRGYHLGPEGGRCWPN
jgi:hypothetical protein